MCFLLVLKNKRQAVTPRPHLLLLWQPETKRANSGRLQPGPWLNPWQGGRQSVWLVGAHPESFMGSRLYKR